MLRNCLILLLLMFSLGFQNPIEAFQIPAQNEASETITVPQQMDIQWEDLGLHNALSVSSTIISAPSSSPRVVHRPQSGGNAPRTNHSAIDDALVSLPCCVLKSQHSASLALPTRSVDYYIYSLNRLRC